MRVAFTVEDAGCESCAELIGAALSQVGQVESIAIDADGDVATVVLSGASGQDAVAAALEKASAGAGHAYSVEAGSWNPLD